MLGEPIPSNTQHAISVSLPTWSANVGYEENEDWVTSKMQTGYPRFFIHPEIAKLENSILFKLGLPNELCALYPSMDVAIRCQQYIIRRSFDLNPQTCLDKAVVRIVELVRSAGTADSTSPCPNLWVVLFPGEVLSVSREFWQHTGEGISSRRAVYCHPWFQNGHLQPKSQDTLDTHSNQVPRGPRRYTKHPLVQASVENGLNHGEQGSGDSTDMRYFVEQRYGRNLDAAAVGKAKLAIKQRISGNTDHDSVGAAVLSLPRASKVTEDDVFLFPTGMSAISNVHRMLLSLFGPVAMVEFGFPYIDTLKVLQKFGNECIFFGNGDDCDLNRLEDLLKTGKKIGALFCEFPSNPLLRSPNLSRLRALGDLYEFVIVVDETIGNFINVDVLSFADILVSSLTKIFSGDGNVMGGSCIINPRMKHYTLLKAKALSLFEDNYWGEDVIFMERNSRDLVSRILRINVNAEALSELFLSVPNKVKKLYYPKYDASKMNYDACKCPEGGYGGLLSVTFHRKEDAVNFYDAVDTAKGPSLGTNFTLISPYALLAHYNELEWIAKFGVESHLVRVSIGLEDTAELLNTFRKALEAVQGL